MYIKYKKTLSVLFMVLLLSSQVVFGQSKTVLIMDNDALPSSGTSNPQHDPSWERPACYNMPCYMKSSLCYNGDARRGVSGTFSSEASSYGCQYVWEHALGNPYQVTLEVYVWDNSFTADATYESYTTSQPVRYYGTLNQNKAKGGWNIIGKGNMNGVSLPIIMYSYTEGSTKYVGADAVRIAY